MCQHDTNFRKWIYGVFVLFDHALKTNLKAVCIAFLYYSDGDDVKFPINFRFYYQDTKKMPWRKGKNSVCKTKLDLALEMIEWALGKGFPRGVILADSWFGSGPFIEGLKSFGMTYIIEIKVKFKVRVPFTEPKLTATGKKVKNQYALICLSSVHSLDVRRLFLCLLRSGPFKYDGSGHIHGKLVAIVGVSSAFITKTCRVSLLL